MLVLDTHVRYIYRLRLDDNFITFFKQVFGGLIIAIRRLPLINLLDNDVVLLEAFDALLAVTSMMEIPRRILTQMRTKLVSSRAVKHDVRVRLVYHHDLSAYQALGWRPDYGHGRVFD